MDARMRIGIRAPHAALVLMVCWLSAPAPAFQTKIHRIQSGGDSIQSAIDAARNGDEIIVGPGIYRERIDFLGKSITLRSESGAEYTLIDGRCQEESPSCSSVVTMRMGEGPDTRLIGFSIAGGRGTRMARDERHRRCGGGLLLIDSSPVISNCLILNNQADEGGACFSRGGTPVFENCWFYLNESIIDGAEIRCVESRPRLIACGFHRDGIQWEDVGLIDVRNDCGVSGACCLQEHCIITTLTACVDAAGVWQGENRLCVPEVCPAFCVEDVNADGRVNMTDVLRVLDSWGRCGGTVRR